MNEAPLAPMSWRDRIGIIAVLVLVPVVMFHQSFKPELIHFSSDGPLGIMAARDYRMPDGFTGFWFDSNWLGQSLGSAAPTFTLFMMWFYSPVMAAKFLAPTFVLVAGLAAAFCFRVFGFRPMVCLLAGIAAEMNSNFFSNACWGVGSRGSSLAATFIALAAIWSARRGYAPLKLVLAGFATGMAVTEGADNGVLFSLFIAAFAFYLSLVSEGSWPKKIIRGIGTVALVAIVAVFLAFLSIKSLVGTQITGKANMEQTAESKEKQWVGATLWSLPKKEILRVIIPGVFGYRMDTPEGGEYWGGVGADPAIPELQKQLHSSDPQEQQQALNYLRQTQWRSSGAGEYAGVLVVLIAAWAVARALTKKAQTFSALEKKLIWFWAAMFVIAVLFGWGHYAPFYQLFYALPYMSTIRNPMKFMHPGHMTLIILFAYGLQGLSREYLEAVRSTAKNTTARAQGWWASATSWEKKWTYACIGLVVLSAIGWMAYSSTKSDLAKWMGENAIAQPTETAKFSIHEVGYFVLVLVVCVAALIVVQTGMFRGRRAVWAGALLGLILFGDFARANAPWIQYYDYKSRYADNPVFNLLSDKRWEHRVAIAPFHINEQFNFLQNYYHAEWLQHQFQYYNIQTLDVANEGGRVGGEKLMYLRYVGTNIVRYWQLTDTRYILGIAGLADGLNQQLDPVQKRFRQVMAFTFCQTPGSSFYRVETNQTGPFALIEFTGALPRAKLYSQWQVNTNDTNILATLASPSFDPETSVIVNNEISASTAVAAPNTGTVEYASYAPKHFEQRVNATTPSVLLVNDHYDPDWSVTIDGKPEKILRANFVMRGLQVPVGQHTIVWQYRSNMQAAYISWTAFFLMLVLVGVATFLSYRHVPRKA